MTADVALARLLKKGAESKCAFTKNFWFRNKAHGNVEHKETKILGNYIWEARGEEIILQMHLIEKYIWTPQLTLFIN